MFWPAVDAAILACLIIIGMNLFFLITGLIGVFVPQMATHVEREVLVWLNLFCLAMMVSWSALALACLAVRRHNPDSTLPGLIITYMFGHPLVVLAWFNGVHSIVTGLLLAVTPAFGFVMFKNRHVMNALLITWLEIIILAFAVSMGWLVDAPLFGDEPPNRFLEPVWLLLQVLIGFPVVIGFLLFIRYIIQALRHREAQVRELSRRDPLTGVWNRGYFAELLERESALAERNQEPLSLVVADLDFFKQVNDTHGHSAGDKALITVARVLGRALRKVDHLGRFGGEEFILLLPGCDGKAAGVIAERCRKAVADTPIDTGEKTLEITASFGVATVQGPHIDTEALFRQADAALYQAKDAGRNQVIMAFDREGTSE